MSGMDDRSEAYENKFAHDEELRFKAEARRNKLLGLWAAEHLGKTGDEAEAYAREVVLADFEEAGDNDVFRKVRGDFDAAGAVLVGISPDAVTKHDKFKAKHSLNVTLAADESKETLEAYGVWVEKSMYGRKYMGVERSTFLIGKDGKIAQAWRKVKVPGHVRSVLEAVKAA